VTPRGGGGERRSRPKVAQVSTDLREVMHGGAIRQLADIDDAGAVHNVVVAHPDGDEPLEVDADRREIRVWVEDGQTLHPFVATLVAPCNGLWRKPPEGSNAVLLRPAGGAGPGVPFLIHGDGGSDDDVPASLDDTNMVLSAPTGELRLESRDDEVNLTSDTGNGKTVNANGTDYSGLKTETFESQLSTLLTDILTELAKGTSGSPVAQQLVGIATLTAKITAFATKLGNGTFESDKFKHG